MYIVTPQAVVDRLLVLSLNALLMLALSRSLYMLRALEPRLVVLDLTPDSSLHKKLKILSEKLKRI